MSAQPSVKFRNDVLTSTVDLPTIDEALMAAPTVSIVIPARNAARTIAATLSAALAQDYLGKIQIVVADGSDDDSMARIIREQFPSVIVVPNPDHETAPALNRAISRSTGEIIVRCDAHAVFPPHYVNEIVDALNRTGAQCVGGMQVPVGSGTFSRAVAMAITSPIGSGDSKYKVGGSEGPTDTVHLGAWRRETLDRVGGFNETLVRNQDYELNWRIRQQDGTVWLLPHLKVEYVPRDNPAALARQYFDYGRWKAVMLAQHPKSIKLRQLAPPLILIMLVAALIAAAMGHAAYALPIPATYLAAMTVVAIKEGTVRRDAAVLLLPIALIIKHVSWGSGLLLSHQIGLVGRVPALFHSAR